VRDFTKGTLKILGWVAAFLALVLVVLRLGFVDVITVGHNGMAPTIVAGDQVALWRGAKVETGDVVLCEHPVERGRYVLARVIARPGQALTSERGQLLINNQQVRRDVGESKRFYDSVAQRVDSYIFATEYLGNNVHPMFLREHNQFDLRPHTVRTGLFVLGDNRGYRGEDSRTYGEVDESTCKGVVCLRLVPAAMQAGAADSSALTTDDLGHGWLDYIR